MEATAEGVNPRIFRILSIDGGGVRGAFVAGYLAQIEASLGDVRLGKYFDLIAGTSTGGIIAAALALREPASRIKQFYINRGPKIFRRWWENPARPWYEKLGGRVLRVAPKVADVGLKHLGMDAEWLVRAKYNVDELEKALSEVFAERRLGEAKSRLAIPAVNVTTGMPKVFKTSHTDGLFYDYKLKMKDVLLATTAAPTYFPHAEIEEGSAYVDGGLWANNPSMVGLVESMLIARECKRPDLDPRFETGSTYMLSIGTGKQPQHASPPGKKAGIIWWAVNSILDQMYSSQSNGINFQTQFILQDRLVRTDFDMAAADWSLDNASVVKEMVHIGEQKALFDLNTLTPMFFTEKAPVFHPFFRDPPQAVDD